MPKEFIEMINTDIKRIDYALNADGFEDYWLLFNEMNGKYHACIKDFYMCMNGASLDGTCLLKISEDDTRSLRHNLQMIKANLETYRFGMNAIRLPEFPRTSVNVTTNVNIDITFEQAKEKVQDMTSLTDEQSQEIIDRINQLESTISGTGSKKSKWEAIKPTLHWLAEQSLDIAKIILPLLLK